ncbi:NAD(P)-binding protein [Aspergillus candidus]|uniref:NAD(P)-binding protein n=1 Tax=Aspergillus candidus TaxID=41067 RepID=A0A2I2FHK4_ASPCN|nr:NAD(P)-binding protein [Aspergillus candidus]PLB40118.1 NAD(P)-binding protein [Aspergillus candidus]
MKVALITGGASGIGLAVARALADRGNWAIHIVDQDAQRGSQAAQDLPNTTYHQTDITDYADLANTFDHIFTSSGRRLDFVFANAGIIERTNFYEKKQPAATAPQPPDLRTIQVNLNGAIYTTHLALHYFRLSPANGHGASLLMTASCGGLYPSHYSPLYTASKYGVVGFMRSVANACFREGIRINALCPGIVQTNLVDAQGWSGFPPNLFIPVAQVAEVVLALVDGGEMVDATGKRVVGPYGCAVELSGSKYYFREQPAYCDAEMEEVMRATVLDNQVGAVLNG